MELGQSKPTNNFYSQQIYVEFTGNLPVKMISFRMIKDIDIEKPHFVNTFLF